MTDLTVQKPHAARGRGQEALQLQTMTMAMPTGNMVLDVVQIGDEPWFYAPSLARTLEYKDSRDMLRGVPDDEKGPHSVRTPGGVQEATFLTEPGFYRVVFRSQSAVAEPLKRWVFREVLPSLRKTGQYQVHQDAKKLGVVLDFTHLQWEWLRLRPYLVDVIPLALAGYNSVEITRMLRYNTPSGVTVRKQIDRLKELGFLPQVIESREKQLIRGIKAELVAAQTALPAP